MATKSMKGWGKANQNHNEMPLHTHEDSYNKKRQTISM